MKELKSISELASEIKDDRFLALFSAFVKAVDSKDFKTMRKLTFLKYLIDKCEAIHFYTGLKIVYTIALHILEEKDYYHWERKLLNENNII